MTLSNKKRKYIERLASRKPAEAIAKELKLPVALVKKEIEKITGKPVEEKEPVLEKFCWLLFLAIALLLPFPIFRTTFDYANYPKTIFLQLGAMLVLAIWLLNGRLVKSISVFKCPLYLPMAIGFVWGGLNVFWANYSYLSLVQWIHWSACGLVFFLAAQLLDRPKRRNQLLASLSIAGVLVSVMGILQHLTGLDWVHQNAPPAATFANRNMATHYVVGTLPAVLVLLGAIRGRIITWLCAGALATMLTYIYFTVTRAAWLAVSGQFVFLGAYFLWDRLRREPAHRLDFKKIAAFASALVATVCVALITQLNSDKIEGTKAKTGRESKAKITASSGIIEKISNTTSLRFRLIYWENTLKMIKDHPLTGIGIQNYRVQYPNYHEAQREDNELNLFRAPRYSHNDFLQLVAELGVPGLLIMLWIVFLLLRMSHKLFLREEGKPGRLMAVNNLAAIMGICVIACFSSPFYRATPPYLLAVNIAMLAQLTPWPRQKDGKKKLVFGKVGHLRFAVGGAVVSLVLAVIWGTLQYRWVKADGFYEYQRFSIDQEDWSNVIRFGDKVRKLNPYRADTLNTSGAALLKSNKNKEAREVLERYTHYFPHSPSALFYLGQVYENLREYDKAEATLSHAADIVPYEGWVHRILGRVLVAKGKKEEALKEYRLATSATPGIRSFHFYHGRLASELGLHGEAAEQHHKAVEADENWDNAQKYLGLILFNELDQKKEGVEHLKKALQLNPKIHQADMIQSLIEEYEATILEETDTSPDDQ